MKRVGNRVGKFIPTALVPDLLLALSLLVFLVLLRTLAPQPSLTAQAVKSGARTSSQAGGHPPGVSASHRAPVPDLSSPSSLSPSSLSTSTLPADLGLRFLTRGDTIDGEPIVDPVLVQRIERIAATIPPALLAGSRRIDNVRYLAHGFDAGDEAAISYGLFRDPAAALAFGCAVDAHLQDACQPVAVAGPRGSYEDPPGVQCLPLGLAMGAAAYEPDRCEASG